MSVYGVSENATAMFGADNETFVYDEDGGGGAIYYSRPATVFAAVCALLFSLVGVTGTRSIVKDTF